MFEGVIRYATALCGESGLRACPGAGKNIGQGSLGAVWGLETARISRGLCGLNGWEIPVSACRGLEGVLAGWLYLRRGVRGRRGSAVVSAPMSKLFASLLHVPRRKHLT
jgi:hypothetical protein